MINVGSALGFANERAATSNGRKSCEDEILKDSQVISAPRDMCAVTGDWTAITARKLRMNAKTAESEGHQPFCNWALQVEAFIRPDQKNVVNSLAGR